MKKGKVFLVGAGPGDIQLITVKGMEVLRKAEVVLYDRLVNPKLLDFVKDDCELIYCGKLPHRHILRQEEINELLVKKAFEGKLVVRLKGGDPGVFGRVGEEAVALKEHGIPFEIVPGITSGIAAPLYAGIPVTHREYGESFAIVTAHDKSVDGRPKLDWKGLVSIDTIAFYMGVGNLEFISAGLIKEGKPEGTPVILIQWGTFGRQKTLEGTLATIAQKARTEKFSNPAITLVGSIVALRERVSWFEEKPLFGRQILLARTNTGSSKVAKELVEQGADVIEFPKWKKKPVLIDIKILEKIETYEKIIFTSDESVEEFFQLLFSNRVDIRKVQADFYGLSSKTIQKLNVRGIFGKLIDKQYNQSEVLVVGDDYALKNKQDYTRQFAKCDFLVTSYKRLDEHYFPLFLRMLEESTLDTVVFPSSASVQAFLEGLRSAGVNSNEFLANLKVICMGSNTWEASVVNNILPDDMPEVATAEGLVECLSRKSTVRKLQVTVGD
ncbi:uroporphyrinogen-III C-methyltransferase [Bacillus luteolus]|uniref:uroporphyrinogen-III C-methyltransferase n=1 Tax=Litchfieldia luteola TaxID=682179 RepID=A0ABR9QQ44_9BACI|nr:uroporphyrinogen-III C-methyltransferase [Cytobacillus luteolus]MBE4910624.1 uroporphyrinogen-III C-methyltransferase [Cytobacillus luteolus]MBP1943803.1 uroporphyrinogen III methyltransferase/synthase [Cytobacillus luteolus]